MLDGSVAEEIELPDAINQQQKSNGFEGVTTDADGSQVYVAFQREWADDPVGFVKIGRYTPVEEAVGLLPLPAGCTGCRPGRWLGGPVGDHLDR